MIKFVVFIIINLWIRLNIHFPRALVAHCRVGHILLINVPNATSYAILTTP